MLNQFVLVGRLIEIKDNSIIIESGTDKIEINVSSNILENIQNYSEIGGVIAVKGKITTSNKQIELNCEKCTFLSSKAPIKEC